MFINEYRSLKSAVTKSEAVAKEAGIAEAEADSEVIRLKADQAAGENVTASKIEKAEKARDKARAEVADREEVVVNLRARLQSMASRSNSAITALSADLTERVRSAMLCRLDKIVQILSGELAESVAPSLAEVRLLGQLARMNKLPVTGLPTRVPGQSLNSDGTLVFLIGGIPISIDDAYPKAGVEYLANLRQVVDADVLEPFYRAASDLRELNVLERSYDRTMEAA